MRSAATPFAAQLKALREAAGFTQEELATITGLSVHAISALERGERRRPRQETLRAISAALDLTPPAREALLSSVRPTATDAAGDDLGATSLPLSPTSLLGRERDLEIVQRWLANAAVRLITLTGPGGVGKTRLALEIARALAKEESVRVRFISLAAVGDPTFVALAIAEALGLSGVTERELPRRVRTAYDDVAILLVLDNFEHLLAAAPLIADLLASVASLRVLVTSRAPLHIRGERQYTVGPLALESGAESLSPEALGRVPAVRLLLERVRDVQPDFQLTSGNARTVAAICRRLDALPLALELAAPWIKALTVEGLLRRLEENVLLSPGSPSDLPARQKTVNATVAWSYELLDPDEQRAFRRFGALPGLFPIDAAAAVLAGRDGDSAVTDEGLLVVARLIDKSLLLRSGTSAIATCPLYHMFETVRAYALLRLAATGEGDDAMEGLVRYCAGEAALAAEGLAGPAQAEWLDRVREDLESYRGALAWLLERGRPDEAVGIAWGLLWFWVIRGHASEGLRWYERVLEQPSLRPGTEAKALLGAAALWYTQGGLEQARTSLTRAMAIARGIGDTDSVTHAEWVFGHIEHAVGHLSAARKRFTASLEGFKAAGNTWGTGHVLTALAWVALATGDTDEAERLLDESAIALRLAGPWFLSLGDYVRAVLAVRRGEADHAIGLIRESLARIRDLDDTFAFVYALVPLAAAAVLKGDDMWAARILGARDAVTERTGSTVVDVSVDDLREEAERASRARLTRDRWAQAYAAGRRSSIADLLTDLDRALAPDAPPPRSAPACGLDA